MGFEGPIRPKKEQPDLVSEIAPVLEVLQSRTSEIAVPPKENELSEEDQKKLGETISFLLEK